MHGASLMSEVLITPWSADALPTERSVLRLMKEKHLDPYAWSNGPHDSYSPHKHDYDKVIYVVAGSIIFGLPETGRKLELKVGDRLDLPAETVHDATVGEQGVTCLEAHAAVKHP
jgi:quercetin dioxygenase-like cupin family protein